MEYSISKIPRLHLYLSNNYENRIEQERGHYHVLLAYAPAKLSENGPLFDLILYM